MQNEKQFYSLTIMRTSPHYPRNGSWS